MCLYSFFGFWVCVKMSQLNVILQEPVWRERERERERERDEEDFVFFFERTNGLCRWNEEKAEESKRMARIEREWRWPLFEF